MDTSILGQLPGFKVSWPDAYGWAVLVAAGLGGIALAGRANVGKTALLVSQIHTLKVEALVAAGQTSDANTYAPPR